MSIDKRNRFIIKSLYIFIIIYSISIVLLIFFTNFFLGEFRILFHLFLYTIVFLCLFILSKKPKIHYFFLTPIWCVFLLIININTYTLYKLSYFDFNNISSSLKTKEVFLHHLAQKRPKMIFIYKEKRVVTNLYKIKVILPLYTIQTKNTMVFI